MLVVEAGWGRDEFRLVSPDFKAAIKHALYAQRLVPILDEERDVVNINEADLTAKGKAQLGSAKLKAQKNIAKMRALLDLEGSGG